MKKFTIDVAGILASLCSLCLVLMQDPFCVFIFHELEEPKEMEKWRKKHGK